MLNRTIAAAGFLTLAINAHSTPLFFNASGTLSENASGSLIDTNIDFSVSGEINLDLPPLYEEYGFDYAYYEMEGSSFGSLGNMENVFFDNQGLELHDNLMVFDEDARSAGVADGTLVDLVSVVLSVENIDTFNLLYIDFFYSNDSLINDSLTDLSDSVFMLPALGSRAFLFEENLMTLELSSIEGNPSVATISPVPVPAATWLFSSAIVLLFANKRC